MVRPTPESNEDQPVEDVGPQLREAIDRIVGDLPSKELISRSLERARQSRARPAQRMTRRFVGWVALAAAACAVGIVFTGQLRNVSDDDFDVAKDALVPQKPLSTNTPTDDLESSSVNGFKTGPETPSTLWAYHLAAQKSPEALEALLDQHANQMVSTPPESYRFGMFIDL